MKKSFICLANSYKEGGRCIAGVELKNNEVVFKSGNPIWIRPVCETPHGEVPNEIAADMEILDIIEIEVTDFVPDNFQTENVLFDKTSIKVVGTFDKNNLKSICDTRHKYIFSNKGKAVSSEQINRLDHSLTLVGVKDFEVYEKTYQDSSGFPQVRLKFTYNAFVYDLPITDPIFLLNYKRDGQILTKVKELYLVLSLGVLFEDWHYKLVAGIIY